MNLWDSIIRIKNVKRGKVKLKKTLKNLELLKILSKLKLIEYSIDCIEKYYINIYILKNNIYKTKKINTRKFIGWKELRELEKEVIISTSRGLMSKSEGISHKTGGILLMSIN